MVGNATPVKKPKIATENAQNNRFVMYVFFKKSVVSVWQKNIVLDVRKSAFKNPVLSVIKCHPSVIQKVSFLSCKIYIYYIYLDCCVRRILSIQLDFFLQKFVIEKKIIGIKEEYTGAQGYVLSQISL